MAFGFTRYFDNEVLRKRTYLKREWCVAVVADPIRVEAQADGRRISRARSFLGGVLDSPNQG